MTCNMGLGHLAHSEISRVEPLSDLPSRLFSVYLSDLAIRFSVFRQTLSDINLDRSKVKSDKLLCVNTAYGSSYIRSPPGHCSGTNSFSNIYK